MGLLELSYTAVGVKNSITTFGNSLTVGSFLKIKLNIQPPPNPAMSTERHTRMYKADLFVIAKQL